VNLGFIPVVIHIHIGVIGKGIRNNPTLHVASACSSFCLHGIKRQLYVQEITGGYKISVFRPSILSNNNNRSS